MDYMNTVRYHRLSRHRLIILHKRRLDLAVAWYELLRSRPIPYLVPSASDISEFADVQLLIHAPMEYAITRSILDIAVESLDDDVFQWRFNHMERLASFVEPFTPTPATGGGNHVRLQLAVCVLTCTAPVSHGLGPICSWTKELMWYPQFFDHCCNHHGGRELRPRLVDHVLELGDFCNETYNVINSTQGNIWSSEHLKWNNRASLTVQHILMACGVDFQEASVEYVETLNLYVVCASCHFKKPRQGTMTVMSWRRAVSGTRSGEVSRANFISARSGMVFIDTLTSPDGTK